MEIITKEMLAETLIETILHDIRLEWEKEQSKNANNLVLPDPISFDQWLWDNTSKLGEQVYTILGDHIGGEIE